MNLPLEIVVQRTCLLFLLAFSGVAAPAAAAEPVPAACAAAAAAAGLPANLLLSVGLVESGRADPVTGQVVPWPWTVNVDGAGHFFDDEADAAAFVRLAQSSGAGDVDVGCFQVSLRYHPEAFSSLDQAFDPAANASAAAVFLGQLKAQTGSWAGAVAAYHSASPALGLPYQRRVLAAWQGLGPLPAGFDFAEADQPAPDLVVIRQGPQARLVRVFTMDDPGIGGGGLRLPKVFTP